MRDAKAKGVQGVKVQPDPRLSSPLNRAGKMVLSRLASSILSKSNLVLVRKLLMCKSSAISLAKNDVVREGSNFASNAAPRSSQSPRLLSKLLITEAI